MRWKLSDGTVVESGGRVQGTSEAARKLRALLETPPVFVGVGPMPDGSVELETDNDFLLHAFVRENAEWLGLEFETDYVPKIEDAPADVQELVRDLAADAYDPDTIY